MIIIYRQKIQTGKKNPTFLNDENSEYQGKDTVIKAGFGILLHIGFPLLKILNDLDKVVK